MQRFTWSNAEKKIARQAFEKAYEREMKEIEEEVRNKLSSIECSRAIWRIHDYLSEKRKETDRKYDYRYSVLVSVFSRLIAEGSLHIEDLEGLREDKIEKIREIANFMQEER